MVPIDFRNAINGVDNNRLENINIWHETKTVTIKKKIKSLQIKVQSK